MDDHTPSPKDLPQLWRARAEVLRQHGAPDHARLVEHLAAQLDGALAAGGDEALSLVDAARESGYTSDHLGALVKRSVIPNAGRPGAPRIRRSDLPHKSANKPGRPAKKEGVDVSSIAQAFKPTKKKRGDK